LSTLVRAHKEKGDGHAVISLVRPVQDDAADEAVLLKGLGELWVNGIAADWSTLYEGQTRRRVSLPGYAFERVSYPVLVDAFRMIGELVSENVKEGDWYYVPSWRRRVLPEVISPRPVGRTLILCDELGVGRALGAKLESQGEEVICAEKEEVYDRLAEVSRIIHVWGVQGEDLSRERACELYFYSLTRLVRAAQQQGGLAGKEIVVVTSDLHPIVGGEAGSPYKALSQGMLKVLSQENPSLITSHIDITLKEEVNIDALTAALAAELFVQEKGKLVGYRNNRRWIQGYDRLATTKSHRGIRTGGLYVVTGGLGKLGYELSRYLLDSYQARVVLLGRATLPLDTERAIRLEELERMGEVMYLECDISDADALGQAVEKTETRWGSINGVIHAAAVTTGRSINGLTPVQELTTVDYALQFGPKIEGLEALKEVLGDRELDFCLLTSSLSAILGGLGFGAYASANVYMDAYIQGHRDRGQLTNWVSVNLDGLNFKDSARDIHSLNNREIREVLEEVLSMKEQPQVIVSKGDLHRRLKEWVSREEKEEDIVESDPVSGDEGVGTVIERKLLRIWRDFFGKDSIGPDSDFFEIGGDSLKALTMIGRIHKALNTRLSVTEFFKRSSIRKLGEYISTKEPGNIPVNISIPIAERKEFYPLSPAQQRLYFLYTFDKSSIAYNMPQIIKLEGELDRQRLQGAFYKLIRRHESLRTSLELPDGVPMQKILEDIPFDITYTDMMEEGCLPEEEEIDVLLELFVRPFHLDQAPLIRVGLIKIAANEHILMVDMHHIISDGVSFGVLINDFMSLYNDMTLPDLSVQYRDYAEWEQSETRQTEISRQKQFWLRQFATLPALLQLPEDHKRPAVKSPAGDVIRFYLGAEETAALKRIAKKEGVTMFMLILSIYNILIARLGNQEDVVVGTPTAGRPHGDLEKIIGMFVNTLPLRNFPKGNMSVREFLDRVKDNTLACFDNQSYPYESLINELKIERDTSRNPLFDTMFAYHNFSNEALQIPGLTLSSYGKGQSIAKFDLMLNVLEAGEQLFMSFEYATALYNRETINRFIGYFNNIVSSVIRNINTPISRIDVLSREEQLRLLLQGEGEKLSYPQHKTLVEIFEEQARRTPANTALLFNERTVTYRELEIGADTLAGYLEQKGVGAGSVVGIMIDRSPEMILAIIGILKTGATYLPLDGSHPEERSRYILQNSKATFLLTEGDHIRQYGDLIGTIDIHDRAMYDTVRGTKSNKSTSSEAAYIIYTSGTTGLPKGVMVNHRSVINLICSQGEKFRISEKDRVLQFSTICFDASVEQIWLALLSGAALVLIDNETIADQAAFKTYIDRMQVSHLHATPSFLEILDPGPYKNLKRVIAGGEECKTTLVEKFGPGYAFYNEYGPTETTVTSIEYLVPENRAAGADSLPIGRPIDNTRIYILGKNMELLPPGVIGELYIGGDGVAMGYVGNDVPGKFLSDPFREGERVYRSGDLAKWLPDGNLSFFGRTDDQVKLRGFRIQLSEIELRLAAHADVTMSVVLLKEQAGGKYLVGYYTGSEDLKPATLKAFLAQTLPGYMVPSYFVRLENMPLTPTGKIDKKALPDPVPEYKEAYTAPTNEVEAQLVRIWSAVLGVDQISIYSNYFDLGGHSLSIIKMNKMINDHFKCNISIASIFRLPNIHALADYIINGDTKIKELEAGLDEREDALGLISELIN
jgi:amino acid adenylation domain-containing protein